ncbi:MAG TPA: hypothetical protein VKX33_12955 [Cyclobacteriaceae bacterium]|nr:hypothetical protein [Cyclobacteriaceae bacterium]
MRKSIIKLSSALLPLGMMLVMTSCTDDDMPRQGFARAEIQATATSNSGASPVVIGDFTVDHFSVGIRNLDLMFLHHDAVAAGVTLENGTLKSNADSPLGKASLKANHLVLMTEGGLQNSPVATGETPRGIYNEIKFNLNKISETSGHEATSGKSLFLSGLVDGKTVQIWFDSEETISVPAKSSEGYEISGPTSFLIKFNLDRILANVNFNNATDFDKNGIIEIGPNNIEANGSIYNVIKNNIAASVEFEQQ